MHTTSMFDRIPDGLKRSVINGIAGALDEAGQLVYEKQLETKNSVPHYISDLINRNIKRDLTEDDIEVRSFNRYGWTGKVIIDYAHSISYTIMREKRLYRLKRTRRDRPHYLDTLVAVLNVDFEAPVKQMSMDGVDNHRFDDDVINQDYKSIFGGSLENHNGFRHCLIVYDTVRNELTSADILFLDKDLDIIEDISLGDYIKLDFASLTKTAAVSSEDIIPEGKASNGLLSLKKSKVNTDASPAVLREEEMKA